MTLSHTKVTVAVDFSPYPAGRYRSDGPYSGEAFRDDVLAPNLEKYNVLVEFEGVCGYPCGFLEESFGGLVRERKFSVEVLRQRLTVVCDNDPDIVKDIWSYIEAAGS